MTGHYIEHRGNQLCMGLTALRTCAAAQADLFYAMSTSNITVQNHHYGLPPHMYQRFPKLQRWYNILSTTKDRQGRVYVSTIEAKKYPFFGG